MVKYVFVPCFVKFDIEKKVAMTFEDSDEFEIVHMVDRPITNYASVQSYVTEQQMKDKVQEVKSKIRINDEVYLITSGSAFHNALASKILTEEGIQFKFLVFEKRIGKYAII